MLTIIDLGKKLRALDPEKLSHLTDEQIGRRAKRAAEAKGSHNYDIYEDMAIILQTNTSLSVSANDQFNHLTKELIGKEDFIVPIEGMEERIEGIIKYFTYRGGFISNLFGMKSAEWKSREARHVLDTEENVINMYMMLSEKKIDSKQKEILFKNFVYKNVEALLEIRARSERIIAGQKLNLSEREFEALNVYKLKGDQDLEFRRKELDFLKEQQEFEVDLLIKKERALSTIRVDEEVEKAERLADIETKRKDFDAKREWQRFKDEKDLDIKAVLLANLKEVAEISILTKELLVTIDEIQVLEMQIKRLPDATDLQAKMKVLINSKERLEKSIDSRFDGLF